MGAGIILVEGFPGCGKSTTAQWLTRRLGAAGYAATWYYEEQRPHPLAGEPPYASWPDFFSERLHKWRSLAVAATSSDSVHLLESAWLQGPLLLMLRQDLDPGVIRAFVDKTLDALSAAAPVLIYLAQPEPEAGMRALMQRRGMAWAMAHVARSDATRFCKNRGRSGVEGLLHYWAEHNRLSEAIVRSAHVPKIVLSVDDGDWPTRRAAILGFLGIDGDVHLPPVPDMARRVVGTYRQAKTTFSIALDARELVLDGLLWPRNRLLAVSPGVFEMESWPVMLTFVETDGAIAAVRVEAPVVAGRRLDGVYEKVS